MFVNETVVPTGCWGPFVSPHPYKLFELRPPSRFQNDQKSAKNFWDLFQLDVEFGLK
jgi:hypothetical protein